MDAVPAGLQLPSTVASGARVEELASQHPRNPNPSRTPALTLTVLCGAPAAPAWPGSAALPVARAAPRQSHLMERAAVQDAAEWEVGHPLEVPGKGREMSAPTPRPPWGFRLSLCRVFDPSQGFHPASFTPRCQECIQVIKQEEFASATTSDQ